MFAYPCPSCAQRLLAPPERVGQRTVCPKCLAPLVIPRADGTAVAAVADTPTPAVTLTTEMVGSVLDAVPLSVGRSGSVAAQQVELDRDDEAASLAVAVAAPAMTVDATPPPAPRPAPPRPRPLPNTRPSSRKPLTDGDDGRVVLNPTGLFAVDLAAELSAAISMRMAPPPEPVSDRRIALAAWAAGTATCALLWLIAVVTAPELFAYVALVGGAMAAFGWLWRAYLAGTGGRAVNGLVTLLPPVAAVRLFVPTPAHGRWPLGFLAAGGAFLALFAVGPTVRAAFEEKFGARLDTTPDPVTTPATASRLAKAVAAKKYDDVLTELKQLPPKDALADDARAAATRDLVALTTADRADVRAAALAALAMWSPADAKAAVRAGLKATDSDERSAACKVACAVLGAEAAAGLAERLQDRADRADAKAGLIRLGAASEAAVLPLLKSEREPVLMAACEVLERVGGEDAEAALKALAEGSKSRAVRQEASQAAEGIAERLKRRK